MAKLTFLDLLIFLFQKNFRQTMSTLTLITENYDNSLNISKEPSLQDKF